MTTRTTTMLKRHFLSSLLLAGLVFSATNAGAQSFLDFAALGSTSCVLGKDVVLKDSNDPAGTNLATLLVGGNGTCLLYTSPSPRDS